jgi:hypothetical protein
VGVTSAVEIMNSALRKLGAEPIVSEDDSNNRARLVKASYYLRLNHLLRSYPWRFNKAYAELALISPQPTDIFDYDYVFQLPTNCARVFGTNLGASEDWEEIENGQFACNISEVTVKYGKLITDVTKFDASFVEVLACDIAADIAYTLTNSQSVAEGAEKKRKEALADARSSSAQTGSVKTVAYGDDWVKARR